MTDTLGRDEDVGAARLHAFDVALGVVAADYLTAAGSATESAAVLDICMRLALIEQKPHEQGKALLDRVVAMLVKLASALE